LLNNVKDARMLEIDLPIKRSNPVLEFEGEKFNSEVHCCLRLWPQDNDTEGFFVAGIKKEE
jgi:16S rRNA C967 or C1407 C5-methylase (RsmB/RsmF family)